MIVEERDKGEEYLSCFEHSVGLSAIILEENKSRFGRTFIFSIADAVGLIATDDIPL